MADDRRGRGGPEPPSRRRRREAYVVSDSESVDEDDASEAADSGDSDDHDGGAVRPKVTPANEAEAAEDGQVTDDGDHVPEEKDLIVSISSGSWVLAGPGKLRETHSAFENLAGHAERYSPDAVRIIRKYYPEFDPAGHWVWGAPQRYFKDFEEHQGFWAVVFESKNKRNHAYIGKCVRFFTHDGFQRQVWPDWPKKRPVVLVLKDVRRVPVAHKPNFAARMGVERDVNFHGTRFGQFN